MSSLVRRGAVLAFARVLNYGVLLLSPVFLVRLLDVETYGQYREFVLYSMAAIVVVGFSVSQSLTYFLPLGTKSHATIITQTTVLQLGASLIGVLMIWSTAPWLLSRTSFGFLPYLLVWVCLVLNFDFLENYWIVTERPESVLAYTSFRAVARVCAVVGAAAFAGDIYSILGTMIVVEAVKVSFVVGWQARKGLYTAVFDRSLLVDQLRFTAPLGVASVLLLCNERIGQFAISAIHGPIALAIFTIGIYQLPVIAIVRSAVADTLFPDMVRAIGAGESSGLELWRRATVLYCLTVFPIFVVAFTYADVVITTLFTDEYAAAVPIFRLALFMMIIDCYDALILLRATGASWRVMTANVHALVIHVPTVFLLLQWLGLAGAILARLLAELVMQVVATRHIVRLYRVTVSELFPWERITRCVLCAVVPTPVLVLPALLGYDELSWVVLAIGCYLVMYAGCVRAARVDEAEIVARRLRQFAARFIG